MTRAFFAVCCAVALQTAAAPSPNARQPEAVYDALAIRFGVLLGFPVSGLVAGADRTRTLDIPVMVWLLKGSNGPIAQTLDAASNLKAEDRIRTLAASPRLIVPGHEPAVFERFPSVGDGIVRIK